MISFHSKKTTDEKGEISSIICLKSIVCSSTLERDPILPSCWILRAVKNSNSLKNF